MMQNFEINSSTIDKIKKITNEEKNFRNQNLDFFKSVGFPNKRLEDWKFSDFKDIINKNFEKLDVQKSTNNTQQINLLQEFDHNYIFLINGNLSSSNFDFEEKNKIKINIYEGDTDYQISKNPLVCLNHALAEGGYSLEVDNNYKFKKPLVIYNFFTKDINNKILNSKNRILINENSELHVIEYTINESQFNFISNVHENIILKKNSKLKNLHLQNNKSNGFFHKFVRNKLFENSDYSNLIFSSGLKFNKLDIECDLVENECNCNIMSALFLNKDEHQEIKTRINHLAPNCRSYQKVKNVLNMESKSVFQGKIFEYKSYVQSTMNNT